MYPTTIIDKSIATRAWKMALIKAFTLNDSCPEWFKRNLFEITILVKDKFCRYNRQSADVEGL